MRVGAVWLVAGALAWGCVPALREPPPRPGETAPDRGQVDAILVRAEALFARRDPPSVREAKELWLEAAAGDASRAEGLLGVARAGAWLADHEADAGSRLDAATEVVRAAQWCERAVPSDVRCTYWLGVGLGLQARERPSTGLSALPRMVEAFRRAAEAEPSLDEAGPDRALALLYLRAPGWPAGPGDPEIGLEHASKALATSPDYPPNLLAVAEALASTQRRDESRRIYREALARARQRAEAGDPDAFPWIREAERALEALEP